MSLLKFRNQKGFTLIEMMIVIAVIAILAAVIIPKSGIVQDAAKESGVEANARMVQGIIENMLPRYDAADDVIGATTTFRDALETKLGTTIKNPITAVTSVLNDDTGLLDEIDDDTTEAVVISAQSAPASKDENAGVVWVQITNGIGSIVITPYDKDGVAILKGDLTVK